MKLLRGFHHGCAIKADMLFNYYNSGHGLKKKDTNNYLHLTIQAILSLFVILCIANVTVAQADETKYHGEYNTISHSNASHGHDKKHANRHKSHAFRHGKKDQDDKPNRKRFSDTDRDGVADKDDDCPATPRHSSFLIGRGCSVLDALLLIDNLMRPVSRAFDNFYQNMGKNELAYPLSRHVISGQSQFKDALKQFKLGNFCAAKDSIFNSMDATQQAIREISSLKSEAHRLPLDYPLRDYGDATEIDYRLINLGILETNIKSILDKTANRLGYFTKACDAVVGENYVNGIVRHVDDANKRLQLGNGRLIAITDNTVLDSIVEGVFIRGRMTSLRSGNGIGIDLSIDDSISTGAPPVSPAICLDLKVAPVQRFGMFATSPITLHNLAAYRNNNSLIYYLEDGMRLAVTPRDCPTSIAGNLLYFWRYSMEIRISYTTKNNVQRTNELLALELSPADEPIPFPSDIDPQHTVELTTYIRKQQCHYVFGQGIQCSLPSASMATEHITLRVRARNSYCVATGYEKEVFTLEDNDMTGFQSTYVNHTTPLLFFDSGTVNDLEFRAEGYTAIGGQSSRPQVKPIVKSLSFAVYNDDFYNPDALYSFEQTGVTQRSGLMWPRIQGEHNNELFSYSCKLPTIIRDAVDYCDPAPDSYYRLPFAPPGYPLWGISQGPFGSFSHQGVYAYDFYAPENTPISAARGGVVHTVMESNTENCFDMAGGFVAIAQAFYEAGLCDANYVTIQHQDKSFGVYVHIKTNGAYVNPGDVIHRGEIIAAVGNIGYSTGPHLHYQVNPEYQTSVLNSLSSRFQTATGSCVVPQPGMILLSNNVLN